MEFTWTMRNGSPLSCQSSWSLRSAGTRQRFSSADARNWRTIIAVTDVTGRKTIRELALDLDGVYGSGEILQTKETVFCGKGFPLWIQYTGYFCFDERKRKHTQTHAFFQPSAHERTTETFTLIPSWLFLYCKSAIVVKWTEIGKNLET